MPDIKTNNCPNCGAHLPKAAGAITCAYCGSTLNMAGAYAGDERHEERVEIVGYAEGKYEPYTPTPAPIKTNLLFYSGVFGVSMLITGIAVVAKWNQTLIGAFGIVVILSSYAIVISIIWYIIRRIRRAIAKG